MCARINSTGYRIAFSPYTVSMSQSYMLHIHIVCIHINIQSGAKENKYFSWFAAAAITAKELSLNISYEEFANNTQKTREKKTTYTQRWPLQCHKINANENKNQNLQQFICCSQTNLSFSLVVLLMPKSLMIKFQCELNDVAVYVKRENKIKLIFMCE